MRKREKTEDVITSKMEGTRFRVNDDGSALFMWDTEIMGKHAHQVMEITPASTFTIFKEMAKAFSKPLDKMPEDITTVDVRMTLMPNRELMFNGRSLGFIKDGDLEDVRRVIC